MLEPTVNHRGLEPLTKLWFSILIKFKICLSLLCMSLCILMRFGVGRMMTGLVFDGLWFSLVISGDVLHKENSRISHLGLGSICLQSEKDWFEPVKALVGLIKTAPQKCKSAEFWKKKKKLYSYIMFEHLQAISHNVTLNLANCDCFS